MQYCKDCEVFPHIFESSVLILNSDKYRFHMLTSVKSLIEHIFVMPDDYVRELTNLSEIPNKYGDFSVTHQIKEHTNDQEVDDLNLKGFLKRNPHGVIKDGTKGGTLKPNL
jgi:hypothetical protein